MDLETLALDYLERGYSATSDLALIAPNGSWQRAPIRAGKQVFLAEQVAQRILVLQQSRMHRGDGKRDLVGLVLHSAPHRFR